MARALEGWRRRDPPAVPQLAVPVAVPNFIYASSRRSKALKKATGELALIAFYYLLRVGEYTAARSSSPTAKRTINFRIGDVGFFKNGHILPRSSPLHILRSADACTLKLSNQKNGRMGQTIHHSALKRSPLCPVRALAERVHHVLSHGGTTANLLCDYFDTDKKWYRVTSKHLITTIRSATEKLGLKSRGIDPDLVGVHSLRAGGAMALKLRGQSDTTIQKVGRWSSTTFLQYIHNQIAHLSVDLSEYMSEPLPFTNIAAIEPA